MKTTITIAGKTFDGTAAPSGWSWAGITPNALTRNYGGAADEFEFTATSCGPIPPWPPGVEVRVATANDDGSNPQTRFVGDTGRSSSRNPNGWDHAYTCQGLKARGDRITIVAPDGSGTAGFNLTQDDPLYLPTSAGLTVGQILTIMFQVPAIVAQLQALGIGNYTSTGNPPTISLPNQTVADFAALNIVPTRPVHLSGQGLFNQCEDFVAEWHPKYALWVEPSNGTIRVRDIFALPSYTITLPSDTAIGDNPAADGLAIDIDASECYAAVKIIGQDVRLLQRSLSTGGLTPAWSKVDEQGGGANADPPWTILDFTQPRDSGAQGNLSGVSSTGCTVSCDDPKQKWVMNYWPGVQGRIFLEATQVLAGVLSSDSRVITSCGALTAGGSAAIGWDATQPLDTNQYNRFRIVGEASPRALVGRSYNVLGIPDGYSLYPVFPRPSWWANLSGEQQISTPRAVVQYNGFHTGQPPFYEQGVGVQVDVIDKRVLLAQPAAQLSADAQVLQARYPTSIADGLPSDVIVALPVFGSQLNAYSPAGGGYSGLGNSMYGITRIRTYYVPEFTDQSQVAGYQKLADARQEVFRDPVFSVSARHIDYPTTFDPLATGFALQFAVPGSPTPIDGISIPCRSVRVEWPQDGGLIRTVSYSCGNNKRLGGDDLYTHPAFGRVDYGFPGGYESFTAGSPILQDFNATPENFGFAAQDSSSAFLGGNADVFSASAANSTQNFNDVVGGADLPSLAGSPDAIDPGDPASVLDGWRPGHALRYEGPTRRERNDSTADRIRREQARSNSADSQPAQGPAINPDSAPAPQRLPLSERRRRGIADQPEGDS